jgi:hypothetical protein
MSVITPPQSTSDHHATYLPGNKRCESGTMDETDVNEGMHAQKTATVVVGARSAAVGLGAECGEGAELRRPKRAFH